MRTIILSIAVFIFASCGKKKETVFYDLPFEETMALAGQEGKDVYIIISRPGCPPCEAYMNEVNNKHNKDVILNFVDVMHPDNQWYAHWLCSGAFPTTCVFTSEGDLQAVVSGSTKSAMDCVEFSRSGETLCADYFYEARYPYTGDYKEMLGKLLRP